MQKILDAAIAEFSQNGYHGTSTQAIAARAQLKKSALHYYIEDKESLYAQVLERVLDTWRDFMSFDDSGEKTPQEELARFIRLKLDFALEHPQLSRIFTLEVLSGGERLKAYWNDDMIRTQDKVFRNIDRWVEQGLMRRLDSRLLIMHLWALTQYYSDYTMQAELILGGPLTDPERRAAIERELTTFVLLGCGLPLPSEPQ